MKKTGTTTYKEPYVQPSECMVDISVKSIMRKDVDKVLDATVKDQIKELHSEVGIINGNMIRPEVKLNVEGQISGFGLTSTAGNLVLNADEVKGLFVKIGDEYFVKSEFISNKPKNVKAVNVNYKPVEFNDDSPLLGYYNDGTGHLYSVAKLVELTKDLEPFDAPIQAFDLSPEIWRNCSMFELAYHVKLVNEANLDYPIILDWNGGIADGRHRLIKAMVLGHSTIKCVRMTYKPNFDKLAD